VHLAWANQEPAVLEIVALDPWVARELGFVAANVLDDALCVLASEVSSASLKGLVGRATRR
jgi:hypothetical protein